MTSYVRRPHFKDLALIAYSKAAQKARRALVTGLMDHGAYQRKKAALWAAYEVREGHAYWADATAQYVEQYP